MEYPRNDLHAWKLQGWKLPNANRESANRKKLPEPTCRKPECRLNHCPRRPFLVSRTVGHLQGRLFHRPTPADANRHPNRRPRGSAVRRARLQALPDSWRPRPGKPRENVFLMRLVCLRSAESKLTNNSSHASLLEESHHLSCQRKI